MTYEEKLASYAYLHGMIWWSLDNSELIKGVLDKNHSF